MWMSVNAATFKELCGLAHQGAEFIYHLSIIKNLISKNIRQQ